MHGQADLQSQPLTTLVAYDNALATNEEPLAGNGCAVVGLSFVGKWETLLDTLVSVVLEKTVKYRLSSKWFGEA